MGNTTRASTPGRGTKGVFSAPTVRSLAGDIPEDLELQAWSLEGHSPCARLDPATVSGSQAQGLGIKAALPWGSLLGQQDSHWGPGSRAWDLRYWPLHVRCWHVRARETGLRIQRYGAPGLENEGLGVQGTELWEVPGYSSGFRSSVTEQGTRLEKLGYQVSGFHMSGVRNPSIQALGCRLLEVWEAGLWSRGGPVHHAPPAKRASLRDANPRQPCNRVTVYRRHGGLTRAPGWGWGPGPGEPRRGGPGAGREGSHVLLFLRRRSQ